MLITLLFLHFTLSPFIQDQKILSCMPFAKDCTLYVFHLTFVFLNSKKKKRSKDFNSDILFLYTFSALILSPIFITVF